MTALVQRIRRYGRPASFGTWGFTRRALVVSRIGRDALRRYARVRRCLWLVSVGRNGCAMGDMTIEGNEHAR